MTSRTLFALALTLLLFVGCSGSDAVPEKAATTAAQENDRAENDSKSPELLTDSHARDQPQGGQVDPAVERAEAERAKRIEKLKWTIHGLMIYSDQNEFRLPRNIVSADGKPLMSWRVELLQVSDDPHPQIYKQLRRNEPWDSSHNAALLKQVNPRLYANNPDTPDGHADVQAVIGPGFGFSPADQADSSGISDVDVIDGMFSTVMAVEVAPEKAVPWAKPDDYVWNPEKPTEGLGPKDKPYFLAVFGHALVRPISKQESADTLKAAFGRADQTEYELMPVEGP